MINLEQFTRDGQDVKVVERLLSKVQDMLTTGEHINYIALQKKPAVTILPDSITVSNKRIFLCEFTKLGLATDFEIFSWDNIKDIAFKEEIFGSKVTVIPNFGENLSIDYIPKVQARKLYQLIKDALEQSKHGEIPFEIEQQREEPIAIIEEAPLETIEVIPVSPTEPMLAAPEEIAEEPDELTQKLLKLKKLFDKQLITQAEYENKKNELLSQI